ncbi:hypothetical protein IV203_023228 [Nitzschia inconspicua]|uniref:Uncharacterized protein n=1 Tax=Nitzschia inconspicua TaxID=303405 RepID=A0A9K3PBA5_9STRA|nr:hypothetical protein IV203_023228 [Nitzschia inconspicua]
MTRYNTNKTTISRITDLGEEVRSALNMKNICVAILFLTGHCATNALMDPTGEVEEIRLKKKVGSIEALLEYKPHVRVSKDSEHEDRIRAQRELNYTRVLGMEGYECMGTPTSANLTDNFVKWFITDGSVVGYLEKNSFECTAAYRVVEVLNCDRSVPRTTVDRRPVIPTVDVFDGKHGCADLIAAMNILHGEDSDDLEGETAETMRNLPDSDPYPSACSGQWRACPYNVHYTGMISPITTTSDQRFHQRAHNIQGNQKEWQGCSKGYYIDMAGWERTVSSAMEAFFVLSYLKHTIRANIVTNAYLTISQKVSSGMPKVLIPYYHGG